MYRESHYCIERTFDSCDSDVANPLLDCVGAGLVEWGIFIDIIVYLIVRQLLEVDDGPV